MNGIVSTAWLAEQVGRDDLRLLDCRGSFAVYEEFHIPTAQFLHIETLRMTEAGIPCKMHRLDVLAAIFGQLGITRETPVVAYTFDPDDQLSACYTVWSLAVTGHPSVTVLNGGMKRWHDEDRPLTQQFPAIARAEYPASFVADYFADMPYVRDRIGDDGVVLVDSRTRPSYNGTEGPTIRRGHIPGAILHNYLWDFGPDGAYLPLDALRERYLRQGVTPDKEVITYCVTGREGSSVWFVLKYLLGYPRVRLYQASLTEWSAIFDLPMVLGNDPWGEAKAA
ncbi:MAG: putative thiosulfate sulfurtransferase precursor [bacterium ADurb.Bin429]|nr:MAG: putative thiosulfate sulfurtransferase precursor [bacterium ADurb.Bin429]